MPQMQPVGEERGLYLEAHFEPDVVRIVRAEAISRIPRARLRAPLLTEDSARNLQGSAAEVVLTVLTAQGRILEAFGWPQRAMAFFDRRGEYDDGDLQGGPRDPRTTFRVLRVPVPAEAAYLFFYGSEVKRDERSAEIRSFSQRSLGLYQLKPSETLPLPPLPIALPIPPTPLPLPLVPLELRDRGPAVIPRPSPGNYIKDVGTIVNNGSPDDRFDIVILGDGFADGELKLFDDRALAIANGLLTIPPFSTMAASINIHKVRAVSADSGIADCPSAGPRNTYFQMKGNFNGEYVGFVGTSVPQLIYGAAALIAPIEQLELFLMIVNCSADGGSAFPDLQLACGTLGTVLPRAYNVAAHEIAHVIAGVAEEYISCVPPEPMAVYPNQSTEAHRTGDTIPWKSLATPAELDGANAFRAVHVVGDPFDGNKEPILAPGLGGMLGVFWGCQDIDPTVPSSSSSCDHLQDPRGEPFFRPMAACKMRRSKAAFCRVCELKLAEGIAWATT